MRAAFTAALSVGVVSGLVSGAWIFSPPATTSSASQPAKQAERTPLGTAITMPDGVVPPVRTKPSDPATEQQIRDALQSPAALQAVGDPMLRDIIQSGGGGSVLSGSLLDEMADKPLLANPGQDDAKLKSDSQELSAERPASVQQRPSENRQLKRMKAAEALLKACRLIGQLDDDAQRDQLLRQMRAEAVRLISEPATAASTD
ncbi:hypothetical protein [Rhodopirellula sp. MGV]|uniref:hypothetical protein n=1 Tax=Rhodopirellula sp. MGV TaxID=2023130 RepID=UPI000B960167|nr:hypothetical protein [Rhodopirellula sp. MGV]OYP35424.1 hypothetical protein CGZ80_11280 [Rhodopirellula sp. MGV]PNY33864.1 hypothetical protein C2E31_25905 [Rhodopirellula baltica]